MTTTTGIWDNMPLHPFETATIEGLLQTRDGKGIPLELKRATPKPVPHCDWEPAHPNSRGGLPPPSPQLDIPLKGDMALKLSLTKQVGKGYTGFLYEAEARVSASTGHKLTANNVKLPPLVVKIAGRARQATLQREAWFYDDLQVLQGYGVPRCFGYFDAVVPKDTVFSLWKAKPEENLERYSEESDYWHWTDCDQWRANQMDLDGSERSRAVGEVDNVTDRISILVMERLSGELLPLNHQFSEAEKNEVYELYRALSELCVDHIDISWTNILRASSPESGSSISSYSSPKTALKASSGEVLKAITVTSPYRLIDFGHAVKVNLDPEALYTGTAKYNVDKLLKDLMRGRTNRNICNFYGP